MNIKQQAEHVEIIKDMHLKVERLWGEGSKQEVAMKKILEKEDDKLYFMLLDKKFAIEPEDNPFSGWRMAKLFMSPETYLDIKGWEGQ
tara:strand:- start:591 stop:854 length:264 start_codon:yes stop_codon:yes gene_type:complete